MSCDSLHGVFSMVCGRPSGVIKHGKWRIPELNGGFRAKIIELNGRLPIHTFDSRRVGPNAFLDLDEPGIPGRIGCR
jgi:hypothetical protein